MARGWESKAIEAQQEAAAERAVPQTPLTPAERELQALEVTRRRLENEIEASANPRFRDLKRKALEHVEREMARLRSGQSSSESA